MQLCVREQIYLEALVRNLVRIELEDAKLDEIDLEGVLGFAEHVLTNAARLWMEAFPERKARLQQVLFPNGLTLQDGKFGTATSCFAFTQLTGIPTTDSGVASQRDSYHPHWCWAVR